MGTLALNEYMLKRQMEITISYEIKRANDYRFCILYPQIRVNPLPRACVAAKDIVIATTIKSTAK